MRLLRVIAVVLLCAVAGIAQTNKGAISGTVFDSNGAAVPGASVTITNLRTGQRLTRSTTMLADGVNNTGVGIARSVVNFTPETVQEFTVQTTAYSAEFGNTAGGVINVTTKSGTNKFSGILLWYHRNPKFNATPFNIGTAPRPNVNLRYN